MSFKLQHAVAALALVASVGAQAATYDVGTLTSSAAVEGVKNITGTFEDFITFSVVGPNNLIGGFVKDVDFDFNGITFVDIDNFSVSLADSAGTDFSSALQDLSMSDGYLTNGVLASGTYSLKVTGTGVGVFNNSGRYEYALSAAPVPEPETYAMLLAGLGLLAGVARRRV